MSTSFVTTSATCSVVHTSAEAGRQRSGQLWSNLADICSLLKIAPGSTVNDTEVVFQHIQFKAGQRIHTIGQSFEMLYIVNSGFVKTVMLDEAGNEQVLSFPMKGDMFGVDGIHSKQYASEAVALTSCDVIIVPFKIFSSLGRKYPELEMAIYSVMSRELIREQSMVNMLGSLSADARVARFLTVLSERFSEMGYSSKEFNLRMTRQEIGSYLGLTLETVSRTLSAFDQMGYVSVEQRTIIIKDAQALKTLRRLPPSRDRIKCAAIKKVLPAYQAEKDMLTA